MLSKIDLNWVSGYMTLWMAIWNKEGTTVRDEYYVGPGRLSVACRMRTYPPLHPFVGYLCEISAWSRCAQLFHFLPSRVALEHIRFLLFPSLHHHAGQILRRW